MCVCVCVYVCVYVCVCERERELWELGKDIMDRGVSSMLTVSTEKLSSHQKNGAVGFIIINCL